jgi:hypothetical protein
MLVDISLCFDVRAALCEVIDESLVIDRQSFAPVDPDL